MTVWSIVVAGGSGRRFGGAKQFESMGSESVLDRSVRVARSVSDGVVVALAASAPWVAPAGVTTVAGGATRAESVRNALVVLGADAEIVVVHDAVRPFASADLFRSVVAAVRSGAAGAVPGVAVTDTVKRVRGSVVVETLDRSDLVAVQTPQAFRADLLIAAHSGRTDATDDAALVEACGGRVVVVPGEAENAKITWPGDLDRARARAREA